MLHKKTNQKKQTSPWTFRPDATTSALWPQLESAHPALNASQIINAAIQLHGAEAARLLLAVAKAKIEAELAVLATLSAEKVKPQPPAGALAIPQRPAEALAANGESGDGMKAIEAP